jgi:very-short-patch-repair endonuclease
MGIKVLRFTNEDIDNRIEWVIEQIKSFSPLGETGKGVDGEI